MPYKMSTTCQIANLAELYQKYFPDKTDGVFVDVGSHDGYSFSNVWGLAQAGWTGVCFEPIPELFDKCEQTYINFDDVAVLNDCIGNCDEMVKLYTGENPTIDEETVQLSPWGSKYDESEFISSKCYKLDSILPWCGVKPNFQVLSIDVEGAELQVLEGFSWKEWKPKMIIIETHENNPDHRKSFHAAAINDWFAATDYEKIQIDGLNAIYILKE